MWLLGDRQVDFFSQLCSCYRGHCPVSPWAATDVSDSILAAASPGSSGQMWRLERSLLLSLKTCFRGAPNICSYSTHSPQLHPWDRPLRFLTTTLITPRLFLCCCFFSLQTLDKWRSFLSHMVSRTFTDPVTDSFFMWGWRISVGLSKGRREWTGIPHEVWGIA